MTAWYRVIQNQSLIPGDLVDNWKKLMKIRSTSLKLNALAKRVFTKERSRFWRLRIIWSILSVFSQQIITISQDLRHNRFCLRLMFKRPDHLPLGILNGHNSLVAGSYKHSLGEYVAALKQSPDDPLLNLLIGITFIHMASQKFATKRHSLVVQVCSCSFALFSSVSSCDGHSRMGGFCCSR